MFKQHMIELLMADLSTEMHHMHFYLRNASSIKGLHRQEFRELFLEEAASEMKHVQQFQDLIVGLDGVLSPVAYIDIPVYTDTLAAVKYAFSMENEVVNNYVKRLEQARSLGGPDGSFIEIFLEEQILHSRTDADNLRQLAGI